ncbi:MAG TPA: hypothetical protein VF322_08845 [Gammaproteobacteria bacterium]
MALLACTLSAFVASQWSTGVWYLAAFAFTLIGAGATLFPALATLTNQSSVPVRMWWASAMLSLGVLLLVGILVVRFVRVPVV